MRMQAAPRPRARAPPHRISCSGSISLGGRTFCTSHTIRTSSPRRPCGNTSAGGGGAGGDEGVAIAGAALESARGGTHCYLARAPRRLRGCPLRCCR